MQLQFRKLINPQDEWRAKLDTFIKNIPNHRSLTKNQIRTVVNGLYNAMHAILHFDDNFPKLNSETTLFRSMLRAGVPFPQNFEIEKVNEGIEKLLCLKYVPRVYEL